MSYFYILFWNLITMPRIFDDPKNSYKKQLNKWDKIESVIFLCRFGIIFNMKYN
jgi:hypothetical protein